MSENCVNNVTIYLYFFFPPHFFFVDVLKRVFVWEVDF